MTTVEQRISRNANRWTGRRALVNLLLIGACVLASYPFVVMILGGLKTSGELASNPAGIPRHPTLANFRELFTGASGHIMIRALVNTVVVTVPYTLLTVLFAAMAGYAFAKYEFRGRKLLFGLFIASILVPIEVNIPALYIFFARIHWLNSYQVQIIPGTASVLGMFMARQFMMGIPTEVLDAARVDGAGHFRIFWRIAMPMAAPVLGAIGVLTFVAKWSDYLWPVIMVGDAKYQPVMVALPSISTSTTGFIVHYELLLAGCLIVIVPLVALFLRYQDTLMAGTTGGAVRG
jgi:ABC-type glycerol-3-phosphate transport system permease component